MIGGTAGILALDVLLGCATIPLTRGLHTLVDERDYPRFAARRWQASPASQKNGYYARRFVQEGGTQRRLHLHREVLTSHAGPCPAGMETRHLNGDPLDNRQENLAWGTHRENVMDSIRHGTYRFAV
jgi:hypothetical protein